MTKKTRTTIPSLKKENEWGGPRQGSGVKPGTRNALKPPEKLHTVKRMIVLTQAQADEIDKMMEDEQEFSFAAFSRRKLLKKQL